MSNGFGSLAVVGLEGTAPSVALERWIRHHRPAGFILFERNVGETPEQVMALNRWLYDLVMELDGLPPLLAIDHEGGAVHRLKDHATRFPPWRETAQVEPEAVARIARQQGEELCALGFNWLLGPVADLAPERTAEGRATVLGKRCLGADPEAALPLLREFLRGSGEAGILNCAKHFPGYGAVTLDPHADLPVLSVSPEDWRSHDLAAFAGIVGPELDAIMLAHLSTGLFGSDLPPSLDAGAVRFIREELGYDGVLLPDDLAMGAIVRCYDWNEVGAMAVRAGLDLLLLCHPHQPVKEAITVVLEAMGPVPGGDEQTEASRARVNHLREKVAGKGRKWQS